MTFLRASTFLIGALPLLVACQSDEIGALPTDGLAPANANTVAMCHFPGHERTLCDGEVVTDFQTANHGQATLCTVLGGKVLEVSFDACAKGHGVEDCG